MATALYRRYRPESFAEMIGQDHVTAPLSAALRNGKIGHAYLFSGPRGCGKTTSARVLARCLNCVNGPTDTPCGQCPSCVELGRDGGGAIDVVEIDAASHGGVDDARDLRERATFAPARDRYKIFIIDEAHMVTPQGFNALLKIVEEPPEYLKFIFATTEPEKVLGTIRSRTHHYPFRLIAPAALMDYVQQLCDSEGVTVESGVLPLLIRAGGGSARDTLSILDQLIAGSEGTTVTLARATALLGYTSSEMIDGVVDALAAGDAAAMFHAIESVIQTGQDPRRFVEDLLQRLRDLIVIRATTVSGASGVFRGVSDAQLEAMYRQAVKFSSAVLSRVADTVSSGLDSLSGATAPRIQLELLFARAINVTQQAAAGGVGGSDSPALSAGTAVKTGIAAVREARQQAAPANSQAGAQPRQRAVAPQAPASQAPAPQATQQAAPQAPTPQAPTPQAPTPQAAPQSSVPPQSVPVAGNLSVADTLANARQFLQQGAAGQQTPPAPSAEQPAAAPGSEQSAAAPSAGQPAPPAQPGEPVQRSAPELRSELQQAMDKISSAPPSTDFLNQSAQQRPAPQAAGQQSPGQQGATPDPQQATQQPAPQTPPQAPQQAPQSVNQAGQPAPNPQAGGAVGAVGGSVAEAPAPEIDEEDFEQLKEIWQEIVTELQHKDQNAAAAAAAVTLCDFRNNQLHIGVSSAEQLNAFKNFAAAPVRAEIADAIGVTVGFKPVKLDATGRPQNSPAAAGLQPNGHQGGGRETQAATPPKRDTADSESEEPHQASAEATKPAGEADPLAQKLAGIASMQSAVEASAAQAASAASPATAAPATPAGTAVPATSAAAPAAPTASAVAPVTPATPPTAAATPGAQAAPAGQGRNGGILNSVRAAVAEAKEKRQQGTPLTPEIDEFQASRYGEAVIREILNPIFVEERQSEKAAELSGSAPKKPAG
ncbi:DNA polymerase III subunit gamma and tau [Leucobacter sp. OH1287]|uniref:DNA polymerase III subunit gamma and tau n=1 Tax=Leucobacter sp. OH1287 TaxID=2491049 RepID=UPI0018F49B46|nr:DNA polymerase III subunit gamma and tau [Leucobacter sp. OH1287]